MNLSDLLIIVAVVLLLAAAVCRLRRTKGRCTCCSGTCEGCKHHTKP